MLLYYCIKVKCNEHTLATEEANSIQWVKIYTQTASQFGAELR